MGVGAGVPAGSIVLLLRTACKAAARGAGAWDPRTFRGASVAGGGRRNGLRAASASVAGGRPAAAGAAATGRGGGGADSAAVAAKGATGSGLWKSYGSSSPASRATAREGSAKGPDEEDAGAEAGEGRKLSPGGSVAAPCEMTFEGENGVGSAARLVWGGLWGTRDRVAVELMGGDVAGAKQGGTAGGAAGAAVGGMEAAGAMGAAGAAVFGAKGLKGGGFPTIEATVGVPTTAWRGSDANGLTGGALMAQRSRTRCSRLLCSTLWTQGSTITAWLVLQIIANIPNECDTMGIM